MTQALTRSPVRFEATACAGPELVRSPVSGQPCVHWRLRIVEHLTSRTQLVHEVASTEAFELAWGGSDEAGPGNQPRSPVRIRFEPESARVHATPVLHREGTPGAAAAARAFGFVGPVSVEEVVIRAGDTVEAHGILDDVAEAEGPFRAASRGLELFDATLNLESRSLAPVLLPWALGTAAALLGGMGLATYAAWRFHLLHLPGGSAHHHRAGPSAGLDLPPEMSPPEMPHPRLP
jgi:hypothetical protein